MLKELPKAKDIVLKIREQFVGSSWEQVMKYFLESKDMEHIIEELIDLKRSNLIFLPMVKDIFGFLHSCDYNEIKAVLLIDTSITRRKGYKGIPLSGSKDSTSTLRDKIMLSIYPEKYNYNHNLERWCRQGVLMIPAALTQTEDGDMHYDLWKGFISYLITVVNEKCKDVPWVLIKQGAEVFKPLIKSNDITVMTTHPYISPKGTWYSINKKLKANGQEVIRW